MMDLFDSQLRQNEGEMGGNIDMAAIEIIPNSG
jgi:hypothetical protein